jgi:hypothetical protein
MTEIQLVITVYTEDDEPQDVLMQMLAKLPDDNDFSDVAHSIDGVWVDEEGDAL